MQALGGHCKAKPQNPGPTNTFFQPKPKSLRSSPLALWILVAANWALGNPSHLGLCLLAGLAIFSYSKIMKPGIVDRAKKMRLDCPCRNPGMHALHGLR